MSVLQDFPITYTHIQTHTPDLHLSLQAGSRHGQVSDKREGTAVSGRSENAEGSCEKEARLKLLWRLIFTVSYTTY